jgi:hypothetical protein
MTEIPPRQEVLLHIVILSVVHVLRKVQLADLLVVLFFRLDVKPHLQLRRHELPRRNLNPLDLSEENVTLHILNRLRPQPFIRRLMQDPRKQILRRTRKGSRHLNRLFINYFER